MLPSENTKSRQRVIRFEKIDDQWLEQRARQHRINNPDDRAGFASEVKRIVRAAREADETNSGKSPA